MAYPKKPKQPEAQLEAEKLGQLNSLAVPTPPQVLPVQGGAPRLRQEWMPHRQPNFAVPNARRSVTDVPVSPWPAEQVAERYGTFIKELGDRLQARYDDPAVVTKGAFWDQVGRNSQEVARIAWTRMLARRAGVQSPPLPRSLERDDRYRFLQWVRSR